MPSQDMQNLSHPPYMAKIKDIIVETPSIKTFVLDRPVQTAIPQPGQYYMIWVPNSDEIPLSVANHTSNDQLWFTVANVGDTTKRMHQLNKSNFLGIRGPFGKGYQLDKIRQVLIIGGGYGIAPLTFVAKVLSKTATKITVILGAKNHEELLFTKQLKKNSTEQIFTTEDGSQGIKGLATDALKTHLQETGIKYDTCLTCGPELMMRKIWDIIQPYNIQFQASLERIMKCGIGICGTCMLGPFRVCRDGPVLTSKDIQSILSEFGVYTRKASGLKELL